MALPEQYNAPEVQREIDELRNRLNRADRFLTFIPLSDAPVDPNQGYVAYSDGTGGGFDTTSGEGLYRYNGSSWVFIG